MYRDSNTRIRITVIPNQRGCIIDLTDVVLKCTLCEVEIIRLNSVYLRNPALTY